GRTGFRWRGVHPGWGGRAAVPGRPDHHDLRRHQRDPAHHHRPVHCGHPMTRVVVIGAGNGAGAHLRALRELDCAVTAVVTGHPERRAAALAVCLQHRTKPAGRALRALVDSGALGTFTGGSVSVPWWRPASYFAEPGRGTYARDGGGVLITQAIHTLDLLLWVLGTPVRVRAE